MPPENVFTRLSLRIPQLEELQQDFRALLPHLTRHVIERAVQLHVFPGGQVLVEAWILKHDPESLPHLMLLLDRIMPSISNVPLVGGSRVVSILMVVVFLRRSDQERRKSRPWPRQTTRYPRP